MHWFLPVMEIGMMLPNILVQIDLSSLKPLRSGIPVVCFTGSHKKAATLFGQSLYLHLCSFHVTRKAAWLIRSAADGSSEPADPSSSAGSSTNSSGTTRLIRTIRSVQSRLNRRIQELRKNLLLKLLFFLVGFYCATAFATVIGQTGDWDILSAALAVVVVEGIGFLMYKASVPPLNNLKTLITMFNYWKAGLSLGLFLDSFKY